MPILTCQGSVEIVGKSAELKESLLLDRHVVSSDDPPLHTVFLKKDSLASKLISASGCFVLNSDDLEHGSCERLLDCFKVGRSWTECEVVHSSDAGDSISFTGRVVYRV